MVGPLPFSVQSVDVAAFIELGDKACMHKLFRLGIFCRRLRERHVVQHGANAFENRVGLCGRDAREIVVSLFCNRVVIDPQELLDHPNALRFVRFVIGNGFGQGTQKAYDRVGFFAYEPVGRGDIIVGIGEPETRGVGELAKTLLPGKERVGRVDERAVHGAAQQSAEALALVADLHERDFARWLHPQPGQHEPRGEIRGASEAGDGDLTSLKLLAILDFIVDVEAEGHGGCVGGDENVSRAFQPGPLRRGAAATDHLHVSGEQNLERLTSALEENEIDVQAVAFELAGFLGDVQQIDTAADARQSQKEMLGALGRKGRGAQEKEQKKNDCSLHGLYLLHFVCSENIDPSAIYSIQVGLTMKLQGKIALVTGSARGLGWEMIQAFAQEGANVTVCDLSQSDVDGAVSRLGLPPEKVLGAKADVTSEPDVIDLFRQVREKFGRLDILVNNAGFAWPRNGPVNLELSETPLEVWLKVIQTNLTGVFLCSRETLKIMRAQGSGSIINISSPQGKKGKALRGPYCAAKFGVEGLTQVMALENSAYGIRVNALDPGGMVATEAIKTISANKGMTILRPDVIRACAVYLASDEAAGITGRSLVASEWNRERGIPVEYVIA